MVEYGKISIYTRLATNIVATSSDSWLLFMAPRPWSADTMDSYCSEPPLFTLSITLSWTLPLTLISLFLRLAAPSENYTPLPYLDRYIWLTIFYKLTHNNGRINVIYISTPVSYLSSLYLSYTGFTCLYLYLPYLYMWPLYLCLRFCICMCFSEERRYLCLWLCQI